MNPALETIRDLVRGSEFEGKVWLVGGAVRDELLGLSTPTDLDLVTTAPAERLASMLHESGFADSPPAVFERFGTAAIEARGFRFEFATARKESYATTSRKPEVRPASLDEDAMRRDFTVNALAQDLESGEIVDATGSGLADLQARILRTPLDPAATFSDDPLRMLRAVRFRWQLEFEPAPGLYDAIRSTAPRLSIISPERIREEWAKMLSRPTAPDAMRDLLATGLIHEFAPEFEETVGVEQGDYHDLDVWDHTLLTLKNVGFEDATLSLAALLHDIGKPQTRTIDDAGRIRFFGHEVAGAKIARGVLERLRFPGKIIDQVAALVRGHMRLGSAPVFTDSAARRLVRDMGENVPRLLALVEADANSLKVGVRAIDLAPIRERIEAIAQSASEVRLESPLSGEEIMVATGLPAGEAVGRIKHALTERVLEGSIAPGDKAAARKALDDIVANLG